MQIGEFTLVNEEKVHRAIFGTVRRAGQAEGGVGESAPDAAKIAEYDRLGGLILKGKNKVKMGAFYDFEKKTRREKPEIVFVFRDLNGQEVEVPEGEEVPIEVRAADIQKKKVKKPSKKAKSIEDEE